MKVSPWLRYHAEVFDTLEDALDAITFRYSRSRATVYLCGGINGLSDSDCKEWRQAVRDALSPGPGHWNFRVLDPMVRDYRGREDVSADEIVDGDKRDILESDVILVNAARPSWGTAMEVIWAWSLHKPVIAFVEAP